MKTLALVLAAGALWAQSPDQLKSTIEKHLGRPYVWGAAGLKSYDCSGFVWRVLNENGLYLKRTTARKLYFSMPAAPAQSRWTFGNLVFFDNLKHVGIVNDASSFYHAQTSVGTNLSRFDPYWRRYVCGVRTLAK
ncbi:MAG: C40 family peptidase [Bryobacteraceae bacterium]